MNEAIWIIRIFTAFIMVVFGLHQMFKPQAWQIYVPEWMHKLSPMSPDLQMRMHALGNLAFGVFLVAGNFHPLVAAWVALLWWFSILPFAFRVKWDIGLRDLTIIGSLIALIVLLSQK